MLLFVKEWKESTVLQMSEGKSGHGKVRQLGKMLCNVGSKGGEFVKGGNGGKDELGRGGSPQWYTRISKSKRSCSR